MVIIAVVIVESVEQVMYGIPKSVTITTNIPATVFYTLDGSTPTINSSVYTSELFFPTLGTFTFKVLATNGIDSSAIISRNYGPILDKLRKSHDQVLNAPDIYNAKDSFPYSDVGPNIPANYDGIGATPVHNPDNVGYFDGYDGTATGAFGNVTDALIESYEIRYSDSDYLGQRGNGIGNLPKVTILEPPDSPQYSSSSNLLFNPRAKVIYQDSRDETDICMINRPYFALVNTETYKDGTQLDVAGADYVVTSGSFVTSRYNPVEKTMTYYYYDNLMLRWIISKEPYDAKDNPAGDLSGGVFSSSRGSSKVFKWYPFARRRLI
jgi:hypothetical protein